MVEQGGLKVFLYQSSNFLSKGASEYHFFLTLTLLHRTNSLCQGFSDYSLWSKSSLLLIFVNKVLLAPSAAHVFTHCLWLLLSHTAKSNSSDRDLLAHKA